MVIDMTRKFQLPDGNIILASQKFIDENYPGAVDLGAIPEPEPVVSWLISEDAFRDRFGASAIPLLASPDAIIQAFFKFISGRPFINLKRPEIPGALDYILSHGFQIDKDAILNTPCQPGEEPR